MALQTVFKRYELKYVLTQAQYAQLLTVVKAQMTLDEYGHHKITNIYFDTEDYQVIRHSLEKPKYKEKLRLRIYGNPTTDGLAFIELKKKYNGVVYKRRMTAPQAQALDYFQPDATPLKQCQIGREIQYFTTTHPSLAPKIHLSYEREAYYGMEDKDFRLTFDFNIKMRNHHISWQSREDDQLVLPADFVVLEAKTATGLPHWFLEALDTMNVRKTSFSKYGTGYQAYILPHFTAQARRASV